MIDDDVVAELLAEVEGEAHGARTGLGVVAVHVEDRGLDHLGHVGRVVRRPRGLRRGREPDLVVDDEVDGAARAVAREPGEVERLGDDTLAGEGGVAVQEDREDGMARERRGSATRRSTAR